MGKLFGEVNSKGRIRIVEKKFSKQKYSEPDISQVATEDIVASITDSSVMDRIYILPKLKNKQLKVAIQQKVQKDLEFIANINEIDWIFSTYPESKNQIRVLVSIFKKEQITSLPMFKALTTSSQVLSKYLFNKSKENYLLVHSFNEDYLVLVFRNGLIDYLRGFKSESSIEESIELTIEYYKDQHKVDINNILYSGDAEIKDYPGRKVYPVEEFLKIKVKDRKFIVPIALSSVKAPFFYEKKLLKPIHITVPISLAFISVGSFLYFQSLNLNKDVNDLKGKVELLKNEVKEKEDKVSNLEEREKILKEILSKPSVSLILKAEKPEIYQFIKSLEKPLNLSKSYILSISGEDNTFVLSTITFCESISEPKEFDNLIEFLKNNSYIENFELLSAEKLKEKSAILGTFRTKLKVKRYVETN